MAGLDAKFLYSETSSAHMHTLKVAVLDIAGVQGGVTFDYLVEVLGSRLDRIPSFRRRVVPIPWGLGHPLWIDDPDFDIRNHVVRRHADPPGGERELARVVGDFASAPLRRDRPLWELAVVEGMAGGRLAVVAKMHHALADGAAAVGLLQEAFGPEDAPGGEPWNPEPVPSRRELLRQAMAGHRIRVPLIPSLIKRSAAGFRRAAARRRASAARPPLPFATARTPFNVSLVPERTFAMTSLSLDDMKAVRRAFDATLNDVFLATCGGAVRRYLLDRNALPGRPLVASVPVGIAADVGRRGGNNVDNLFVPVATDCADPAERIGRIRAVTADAKAVRAALGNELMAERAELVPPQLYSLAIRAWTRSKLANRLRPPLNLVISNVPGPTERLEIAGAQLESIYSVGPILEGIGVNITAWSYAGVLHVSVLGCPPSLPDPWPLADALQGALDELTEAAKRVPVQAAAR